MASTSITCSCRCSSTSRGHRRSELRQYPVGHRLVCAGTRPCCSHRRRDLRSDFHGEHRPGCGRHGALAQRPADLIGRCRDRWDARHARLHPARISQHRRIIMRRAAAERQPGRRSERRAGHADRQRHGLRGYESGRRGDHRLRGPRAASFRTARMPRSACSAPDPTCSSRCELPRRRQFSDA